MQNPDPEGKRNFIKDRVIRDDYFDYARTGKIHKSKQ